jgi:hypothetical protein
LQIFGGGGVEGSKMVIYGEKYRRIRHFITAYIFILENIGEFFCHSTVGWQ